jgi:SAM-dependent methyltransferase
MRSYLRRGLRGDARLLAGWAREGGVAGVSVLEVGGGVGAIQADLLRAGAASGRVVDVVPAYERFARELAEQIGIEEMTSFLVADITADPDAVSAADVVALRRVVCCSPYGPALLEAAARLTKHVLVLSYPRPARLIRATAWLQNMIFALLRRDFRVYIHPPATLTAAAVAGGLQRTNAHTGLIWESAIFERVPKH